MGYKIRLNGKKHSMLKCFEDFFHDLLIMDGVEDVYLGRFADKGVKDQETPCRIQYYDSTNRILKINLANRKRRQCFYLRINPDKRTSIEDRLKNYQI